MLLDPQVRRVLESYFERDLSDVRTFGGRLSRFICHIHAGADAVVYGRRIFFSRVGWGAYRERSVAGLILAGHEVLHTIQYKEQGFCRFLVRYVGEYLRDRIAGRSHVEAYRAISFEEEAAIVEKELRASLTLQETE